MIKTLILDKVRWLRGGSPNTGLLNERKRMCCLGFCMAQEGVSDEAMIGLSEPHEVYSELVKEDEDIEPIPYLVRKDLDEWDDGEDSGKSIEFNDKIISINAIDINDCPTTTDKEKVEALNKLFSTVGISVVLVDTPAEAATLGGVREDFGC